MRNRLGRLVGSVVMMVGAVAAVGVGVVASTGSSAAATPEPSSVTVLGDSDTWLLHGQPRTVDESVHRSVTRLPAHLLLEQGTASWRADFEAPAGPDPRRGHHLQPAP